MMKKVEMTIQMFVKGIHTDETTAISMQYDL